MEKTVKTTLQKKYTQAVVPALKEQFNITNLHAVPKIVKVVVHVGVGQGTKDAKILETAEETLRSITGQQPVKTRAKKAISNFKIREGMVIGLKVTLRGKRMEEFLEKMMSVALPRVRDFRGISTSIVDKTGNATLGFKEHIMFPEVSPDDVERMHGLEVIIDTTARTKEQGIALLTGLGLPFRKEDK